MVTDSLPHEGVVIPPAAPGDSYRGGYPLNVAEMRAVMARAGRWIMLAFGAVTAGSLLLLTLLLTAFMVHGGLLGVVAGALLAILGVSVAAVVPWCDWPGGCGGATPGSRRCRWWPDSGGSAHSFASRGSPPGPADDKHQTAGAPVS